MYVVQKLRHRAAESARVEIANKEVAADDGLLTRRGDF